MSGLLKMIILFVGLGLCTLVILLLVRKKINERNTLVWLFGMLIVFVLSVNPQWLDVVAEWAGVDYPPSLLFLGSFIVLLIVVLYQSIQISQLYAKIKGLAQFVAILSEQNTKDEEQDNPGSSKEGKAG